jgi:hypothetical protein
VKHPLFVVAITAAVAPYALCAQPLQFSFAAPPGWASSLRGLAVSTHELDDSWYRTHREWREASALSFLATHRLAVARAEADHFVAPIGPSRAVRLMDASSDPSGDVFLRFIARHFSGSDNIHLLIVYRWSARERRFIWKAVEDHSP